MTFTQEQVQALTYSPYWYNLRMDDKITLEAILEDYIEMKKDEDDYVVEEAKHFLEMVKKPIFKRYKDVIHCGVYH